MNLPYYFISIIILSCLNASQLILKDLTSQAYEVGQIMKIEWTLNGVDLLAPDAAVTIDLVNDRPEVMIESFLVVADVPAKQLSHSWTIPRFLKSSSEYHLRIHFKNRSAPKGPGDSGYGKALNLVNPNPLRQSTLNLLEPTGSADGSNLESTCLLGEQCNVAWDYPEWAKSAMPRTVDIKLYSGDRMILLLAQNIPVATKTFLWLVPANTPADNNPVHVLISASDKNIQSLAPGQSFYLASSGYPFVLEGRAEREARRLANSKPTDFTAPGPIQMINDNTSSVATTTAGFDDIPRPTFAGAKPTKITSDSTVMKPSLLLFSSMFLLVLLL